MTSVCIDIMRVGDDDDDDDVDDAAPGNSRPVGTRLPVGPPPTGWRERQTSRMTYYVSLV